MGEEENRAVIDRLYERVWIGPDHDFDVMDEAFAEDAVVEYPQSGERIRGRRNIRAVEEDYPGLPKVELRRTLVVGDVVVVEARLDYQGKPYDEVSIFEFRDARSFVTRPISRSRSRPPHGAPGGSRRCDQAAGPTHPARALRASFPRTCPTHLCDRRPT